MNRYPEIQSDAVLGSLVIASEARIGPRCYPLRLAEPDTGVCVGWYIPDFTDEAATPDILHCLCFTVEPCDARSREDFTQPWATRGLALRLISDHNPDGAIPAYERVGYFELERRYTGVDLPFDAHSHNDLKYNPRRVPPEVDPHGVFKNCGASTLRLY